MELRKIDLNKGSIITETSVYTITGIITKELTAEIFERENELPRNNELDEDWTFKEGEVQFNFDKDTMDCTEILLFPVYEDEDGNSANVGDFIHVDDFDNFIDEVKKLLKAELSAYSQNKVLIRTESDYGGMTVDAYRSDNIVKTMKEMVLADIEDVGENFDMDEFIDTNDTKPEEIGENTGKIFLFVDNTTITYEIVPIQQK